jgi:hypothetical protein
MPSKHLQEEPACSNAASGNPVFPDPAAIRRQLDLLFANPHFRNSRRCQALLRHVAEAYLDGCLDRVKERSIGIEVFGRAVDYDTSLDSIVRTSAGEVRKRLAQYYLEPEHEHEIRIVLPNGSYSPEFYMPAPGVAPPLPDPPALPKVRSRWLSWRAGLIASIVAAVAASAIYVKLRPTEFDRFWMPILSDRSDTVICIEQPLRIFRFMGPRADELNDKMVGDAATPPSSAAVKESTSVKLSEVEPVGAKYFTYGDLIGTARISELLSAKGKPFQLLSDRNTTYHDLRGRPAILLGQFNNQWTLGLTGNLRYYLDKNAASYSYEVRDRTSPGKVVASVSRSNRAEDFAIVSRIFDVSTEKTVIAIVGSTSYGTLAGADFLTHARYMQEAFRGAPENWYRKNIQVILKATVVGDSPGPPTVITAYFW